MLVPIIGYSDSLLTNAPPGATWINEITEIKRAAESAATLTRQLLAFSRKQIISRSEIDLNQLVLTLRKMIHRLIGEDVDLITRLAPDVWTVSADPGQIEQCLVNLCVNARHAIPDSGTITLLSSGYSGRNSLVDLVRTRSLSFLHKPYSLTSLLDAVRETLAGSRLAAVA